MEYRIPIADWHPDKTFQCGQYFHWTKENNTYTAVHRNAVVRVETIGEEAVFHVDNAELWESLWIPFLGLPISPVDSAYERDPVLRPVLEAAGGLTILRQEPFAVIIAFILSANNHFARIQNSVLTLAARYGTALTETIRAFPTPEQLARVSPEELRAQAGAGYRDRYLRDTAERIAAGQWDLSLPYALPTNEARKKLMELPGVGPKVADCILLFGYGKNDVFPVDVWIHRTMQALYWDRPATKKEVFEDALRRFGNEAGRIQQYLFWYGRKEKLGTPRREKNR